MLCKQMYGEEVEKAYLATGKKLPTLAEAASYIGIDTEDLAEILLNDDTVTLLCKGFIRITDLVRVYFGGVENIIFWKIITENLLTLAYTTDIVAP